MIDFLLERQSVKALPMHDHTQEEILTRIEECGRIAYRSEDRITESSASEFVARMQKNGHLSVLEHANIVFLVPYPDANQINAMLGNRKVWHPFTMGLGVVYIAGNVRAWLETLEGLYLASNEFGRVGSTLANAYPLLFGDYANDFEPYEVVPQFVSSDVAYRTFIVRCDRGITHEIVRSRSLSFTQESSRYVRYGSHVPSFYMREPNSEEYIKFIYGCLDNYQAALRKGESPQEARDYLPNCLMSTIAISGYLPAWKHFCELRSGKGAHPRIQELAKEVKYILDI
jgi:thymidylate synthase (FAD)